jgi:predicted HTH transcriptional regulator
VPTVGGILLFGRDRSATFPTRGSRWAGSGGVDRSRVIDRNEIRSQPVRAVEEAIAFVQKHQLHGAEIGTVRRKERWTLPPVAVREAVINAVAHVEPRSCPRSSGATPAR